MSHEPILCWLHISDLHVKDRNGTGRSEISYIINDLEARSRWYRNQFDEKVSPPTPSYVFVTGDVAYSGETGLGEYEGAQKFLRDVCRPLGIEDRSVFLVPGNHDVHRGELDQRELDLLVSNVGGTATEQLAERRFRNFNNLAANYAQAAPLGGGCWMQRTDAQGEVIVVVGLNTALLSATRKKRGDYLADERQLQIYPPALDRLREQAENMPLTIILMHHPFGWLKETPSLGLKQTIWLHGHTHQPDAFRLVRAGDESITVVAGAVRLEQHRAESERIAYNIGAIFSEGEQYRIEIWPRVLSLGRKRFVLDVEMTEDGRYCQSHIWPRTGDSKPATQHKRFWSHAIPRVQMSDGRPVDVWIAAHSAWHTFRPRAAPHGWDDRLFATGGSFLADLAKDVNGDVWKPLADRLAADEQVKFNFRILLAHPYSAEARCVLHNQAYLEPERDARDDFYRTLRAVQLIAKWTRANQPAIQRFDVRVLNPWYRIMTNSLYAVGNHVLFVPLAYSGLANQGFAVWHRGDSLYGRYLEMVTKHFNEDDNIAPHDPSVRYLTARPVDLDGIVDHASDLRTFRELMERQLEWLRESATRERHAREPGAEDPGTFHQQWKASRPIP